MYKDPNKPPVRVTFKRRKLATIKNGQERVQAKETPKQPKPTPTKKVVKVSNPSANFFWNCPVCGANFTSERTKNKHIHIHGAKVVARALQEKNRPTGLVVRRSSTKRDIARKQKQYSTYNEKEFTSTNVTIKDACRLCGQTPAMPGDDICYQCNSSMK